MLQVVRPRHVKVVKRRRLDLRARLVRRLRSCRRHRNLCDVEVVSWRLVLERRRCRLTVS